MQNKCVFRNSILYIIILFDVVFIPIKVLGQKRTGNYFQIIRTFGNKIVIEQTNYSDIKYKPIKDSNFKNQAYRNLLSYDSCSFLNSLIFSQDTFFRNIQFNDVIFCQQADFSQNLFKEDALFENLDFLKYPQPPPSLGTTNTFVSLIFNKKVTFCGVNFFNLTLFNGTIFKGNALFVYSTFYDEAAYINTLFHSTIFWNVSFLGDAEFKNSIFSNETTFLNSNFSKTADFTSDTFKDALEFTSSIFSKDILFIQTKFSNKLVLSGLQLKDSSHFNFAGAKLPDTLDFSNNLDIPKEIDLTTANYKNRVCNIYLYKSDVSKFHIDYIHFKLLFINPNTPHDTISEDERKAMYETLLKSFKDRGQEISYQNLDIEYQDYKWSIGSNLSKWIGKIIKWWWNYGYSKDRVFIHSFWFIFWFTLINFFFLIDLNENVYKIKTIPEIPWKNSIRVILLRLWYSFAYTATIFFSLTLKPDKIEFKRIGGSIYILTIYSIGLVCLAYMANFVLQK